MEEKEESQRGRELLQKMIAEENLLYLPNNKTGLSPEGNLGLLAIGYKGIVAWRKFRKEINYQNENALISKH